MTSASITIELNPSIACAMMARNGGDWDLNTLRAAISKACSAYATGSLDNQTDDEDYFNHEQSYII